ncbi:MAG: hypothetical protein U0996_25020 [Planctomycetaceae bacterium]
MAHSAYDIALGNIAVIHQITNLNHSTNATNIPAFASGNVKASAQFQGETAHSTNVTSTDLATVLALNTSTFIQNGLPLCAGTDTVSVPFRQRAGCATYASGSVHSALLCDRTLITPESIKGSVGQSATIDLMLRYLAANSFTSPTSNVSNLALPDATFVSEFMLYDVLINGTSVPQLQAVTINTGIKVEVKNYGGGPFPTAAFIVEILPTIEITTEDADASLSVLNAAGLGTGVVCKFARRTSGGIIDAIGGANHITVSAVSGLRQLSTLSGDARSNSSGTIVVHPLALTSSVNVAL